MADCGGLPQVVQVGFVCGNTLLSSAVFVTVLSKLSSNFHPLSFHSQENLPRPSSTLFREWATVSKLAHVFCYLLSVMKKYQMILVQTSQLYSEQPKIVYLRADVFVVKRFYTLNFLLT